MIVHGFETSNNMKVRVALGYKGLPYSFNTIDPRDREAVVRISGQHLTPVLEHGGTIVFDSATILRYLESNFRDTPRLFGKSVREQWAIEDEELFARTALAGPLMRVVHTRVNGGTVDEALLDGAARDFARAADRLAATLGDREWLVGDAFSAADVTAGAVMHRIRKAEMFALPDSVERLAPWIERVMAYDGRARLED